jgi:hypothetical protein
MTVSEVFTTHQQEGGNGSPVDIRQLPILPLSNLQGRAQGCFLT